MLVCVLMCVWTVEHERKSANAEVLTSRLITQTPPADIYSPCRWGGVTTHTHTLTRTHFQSLNGTNNLLSSLVEGHGDHTTTVRLPLAHADTHFLLLPSFIYNVALTADSKHKCAHTAMQWQNWMCMSADSHVPYTSIRAPRGYQQGVCVVSKYSGKVTNDTHTHSLCSMSSVSQISQLGLSNFFFCHSKWHQLLEK